MLMHQNSHSRRAQIDFNFNLLPQVPAGSQFSTTLDAISNAGNITSFTVTSPGGSPTTYPATGNAASFVTSHASAGTYTYTAYATDARGYTSPIITKTVTAVVDNVIPYIRHTLNTSSSIQNDSVTSFNIFYGTGGPATGTRSYSILNVPAGMTFSKTTGIVDSESLTMTLNTSISGGKVITIRLTESGLTHDLSVSLSISSPTALGGANEWHYTTTAVKTFNPPQDGNYEIIGIGGGGAGGAAAGASDMGHSSGGGGGSGTLNIVTSVYMYAARSYQINIGAGGTGKTYTAGTAGGTTTVKDLSNNSIIFTAAGGSGGAIPTSNGSGSYGGNGGSGGGAGASHGESNYGGNGGSGGNAGGSSQSGQYAAGAGQGTSLYGTLSAKSISIASGGRSLPPPGVTHPLYGAYPSLGIGEGGYGYGAGGGGGSGTCSNGTPGPGYGGGGAGGIYPSTIAAPKLAAAGERAPGSHISSAGGAGANGYVRIKLIV